MKTGIQTPGNRALRRGRISISNQIYLITFCTYQRQALFYENPLAANAFCAALNHESPWKDAKLLCWVLMPDHVHLLVQLGDRETLSKLMERLKSNTSRSVNTEMVRTGPLWQSAYHDRALRTDEDLESVARYMVRNPIRAGIVNSLSLYPYWNAIWI
ncbi:MAG: transposase [Arenimonas sp.]